MDCGRIDMICPPVDEIYRLLQEKHYIATRFMPVRSKNLARYEVIIEAARKTLPLLQDMMLSRELPREHIVRLLLQTFPALRACLAARYRCASGYEQNIVMILAAPGGMGKTTLAVYLAKLLGGRVLTSEDNIIREIEEMVERGEWVPILVLDDINAIMSKYWIMDKEERQWMKFFKMIDYAKDFAGVLLITARSAEGPPKKFREIASYAGEIRRLPLPGALIDYTLWWEPGRKRSEPPVAIDILWPGLRLPRKYWEWLKKVRSLRTRMLLLEQKLEAAKKRGLDTTTLEQELEKIRKELAQLKPPEL